MDQLATLLSEHGLALVFANVLLNQVGIPVPAVPLLIVAGAFLHHGDLTPTALLATAVAATLLGDLPWYVAGRRYGYRLLNFLCRMAIEPGVCVQQTEGRLQRWGAPSLMVAKFIPGFSTVAPPLAGATRLPLRSFLFFSAIGAALWAGIAIAVGAAFSTQVEQVMAWIELAGLRAGLLLAALLAAYIVVKWVQRMMFMRVLRMARVGARELSEMMHGEIPPLVFDARSTAARRADPRRIPGAVPIDIDMPELTMAAAPTDRDVVIYCT